ncbi:hypothetical protein GCM10010497_41160 [Streptomyces cinereoruber]|uniref:Uncharacterized protein n=1 Tax=Streptomyces cinereoruber TaxID=67260 RepID=A0AAV4KLP1_9ACTN|nr:MULTISPECIES: hypothetical protein [Streptomyces]AVH96366.1 hypothetical protein C5L38_15870 [Streptomyces sp. WAC00288]KYG55017.1 hypothetical protein AWI43_11600 [Streptomyces sp. WAC04657]MBB4159586.1 hypothetical protein [Streptomyces cinereoruber]MBY8818044.1 hypothetical protein [Streptomyces cinereoruber]NIH60294.1 hypothetical protein [Streptomyces cinereoruber]
MFRTTRAPAAFAALLGLVLGLLVWGVPGERAAASTVPPASVAPATPVVSMVSAPGAAVPGCDPGRPAEAGAGAPVVPPRAHGFAELLPVLAADRAPGGVRAVVAAGARSAAPGREPPDLVPPSPVELSVLRV